jgi:hypothetical protein
VLVAALRRRPPMLALPQSDTPRRMRARRSRMIVDRHSTLTAAGHFSLLRKDF